MTRTGGAGLTAIVLAAACVLSACSTAIEGSPVRGRLAVTATESPAAPTSTTETSIPPTSQPTPSPTTVDPAADQPGPAAPEPGVDEPPDDAVGLAPDAPTPDLSIDGMTDSPSDMLVAAALADLFAFYAEIFPETFGADYVPPSALVSYDSTNPDGEVCGYSTADFANAFYIADCDTVAWDREVLLPSLTDSVGVLAGPVVISHEIGHDVQFLLGMPWDTPTLVLEQQADCYAGAFWRWVYDGNSSYFVFNQTEGMRQLLLSLLAVKDPPMTPDDIAIYGTEDNHGNGFDRTYAAMVGYTEGPARCHAIDEAEVDARLQEFPFDSNVPYQYGNLDITTGVIQDILGTVDDYFGQTQPGYLPPTLTMYSGSNPPRCEGEPVPTPVAYCAATNTVSYHLGQLKRIGTATEGWDSPNGDFSAFVLLVTRYALAAQHAGRAPITGTDAGLLSLCYAGTWANWLRVPRHDYQLSPNDLDKAIYEIISSPVAGSDAVGNTSATLIERIQAFGYGVTHSMPGCFSAYLGS